MRANERNETRNTKLKRREKREKQSNSEHKEKPSTQGGISKRTNSRRGGRRNQSARSDVCAPPPPIKSRFAAELAGWLEEIRGGGLPFKLKGHFWFFRSKRPARREDRKPQPETRPSARIQLFTSTHNHTSFYGRFTVHHPS